MRTTAALFLLSGLMVPLVGCKPDAAVRQGSVVGAGPSVPATQVAALNPATLGSVTGTVKISGQVPAPVRIDMSQDPACTLSDAVNMSEQIVAKDGRLANVFVYVRDAPNAPASAQAMQPVTIDQKGCRFIPHVTAIVQGGTVQFTNSDPTMHNVHTMAVQAGNRSVDVSQGPGGKPEQLKFTSAETMLPIRCNNHPWMNAFLNISPTPFFAVTSGSGKFQITGLPQGNYTLVFVHEKLGEQTIPITVKALQASEASVTFTAK
jgi:plastocyanin